MTERNTKIINLRVIAILIVVLGHSIILYDPDWTSWSRYICNYHSPFLIGLKKIINSFQMELFFSISGFCLYYSFNRLPKFINFGLAKFKRLIVPFIIIGLFWMIPLRLLASYAPYEEHNLSDIIKSFLLCNDCGHLWFLPVLFYIFIIFYVLIKSSKYCLVYIPIVAIILFYLYPYIPNYFRIADALKYLLSFTLGFYINKLNLSMLLHKVNKYILFITLFALTSILYLFNNHINVSILISILIVLTIYILTPIKTIPLIKYFDKNSFGIYLFHSPLLYLGMKYLYQLPPYLFVPIQFFGSLSLCLIILYIIRKLHCGFIIGEYAKQ